MHDIVLRTVVVHEQHTGENIHAVMLETQRMFNLEDKKIIYITDQGSNVVKACKLLGVDRFGCIAHGLHNMIMVDGIGKSDIATGIIEKVKSLIKTFTYKTTFLENESSDAANKEAINALELEALCEQLDADEQIGEDNIDEEQEVEQGVPICTKSTTLKKFCPTRWNTVHTMLKSLIQNQSLVESCLSKLRLYEKMCSTEEWVLIEALTKFLDVFKQASALLSGTKYTTVSLVLLFREEIEQALVTNSADCEILAELKQRMRNAFGRRFPIHELYVVAAMLDPSLGHLRSVQKYLADNDTNAVELLTKYVHLYTENAQVEQQTVGVDVDGAPTLQPQVDDCPAWKRAKLELMSKHTPVNTSQQREIQQYRCLSVQTDDPLKWWSTQVHTYPRLSQLARSILSVPATSAPSERVFSVAGLVINAKRSTLSPSVVDKVIFVHDNSAYCE
jgi:hypothetical protein